ncbi:MAG TPA: hypothetical protein QF873_03310 [Patescibacteria group bacterium]|nr:hypothetical protein [Patescibacteria group bacterium]
MSERPPQPDPTEGAPKDSADASAEAWEHHIDNAEKEADVERAASKERAEADAETVKVDDPSAEAWENYIEGEEREEEIARAERDLELADAEKEVEEEKETKKTGGGGGGGGKAISYGPLGMKGGGIGYSEKRERDIARGSYNLLDNKVFAGIQSAFRFLQLKFAGLTFGFMPGSNPPEVDKTPAVDPHLDKPEK